MLNEDCVRDMKRCPKLTESDDLEVYLAKQNKQDPAPRSRGLFFFCDFSEYLLTLSWDSKWQKSSKSKIDSSIFHLHTTCNGGVTSRTAMLCFRRERLCLVRVYQGALVCGWHGEEEVRSILDIFLHSQPYRRRTNPPFLTSQILNFDLKGCTP